MHGPTGEATFRVHLQCLDQVGSAGRYVDCCVESRLCTCAWVRVRFAAAACLTARPQLPASCRWHDRTPGACHALPPVHLPGAHSCIHRQRLRTGRSHTLAPPLLSALWNCPGGHDLQLGGLHATAYHRWAFLAAGGTGRAANLPAGHAKHCAMPYPVDTCRRRTTHRRQESEPGQHMLLHWWLSLTGKHACRWRAHAIVRVRWLYPPLHEAVHGSQSPKALTVQSKGACMSVTRLRLRQSAASSAVVLRGALDNPHRLPSATTARLRASAVPRRPRGHLAVDGAGLGGTRA